MTHDADCALILYAGKPVLTPLICDCSASDSDEDGAADEPVHHVEPSPAGPTVTLTGAAARALGDYRRLTQANRAAEAKLLARLADELAK